MRIPCLVLTASLLFCSAASAQQSALDRLQWTKFEDQNELGILKQKAFTIEVPRDWPVDGGMARMSAMQVTPYIRALAPDGSAYLMIGTPDTPSYLVPNKTRPRVGETFHPNGTSQLTEVQPYTPGMRYAQQIGAKFFASACTALKFEASKDRPDWRDFQIRQYGGTIPDANNGDHSAREDAGEATWTCQHGNKPVEAHLIAVTRKTSAMCTIVDCIASWNVDGELGYVVPAGKAAIAEQAVMHMITSIVFNPAWQQAQSHLTAAEIDRINRSWQQMEQTIAHIQRRQAAFQQSFQAIDDTVSGIHEYHNAEGTPFYLDNNKTQWECGPRLVGTANDVSPGAGCSRLSR